MSYTDLVFEAPSGTGGTDLVFGDFAEAVSLAELAVTIAAPSFSGSVARLAVGTLAVAIAGPTLSAATQYSSGTDRPTVAATRSQWQEAAPAQASAADRFTDTLRAPAGATTGFAEAQPLPTGVALAQRDGARLRESTSGRWQSADRVGAASQARWQTMSRGARRGLGARWQNAERAGTTTSMPFQSMLHDRRIGVSPRWQEAAPLRRGLWQAFGPGARVRVGRADPWQNAMRPPPGSRPDAPVPPVNRCYVPSPHLVFSEHYPITTGLVFRCERDDDVTPPGPGATVVVPVRSVYMTTNNVFLSRLPGGQVLPALRLSMAIDAESWTWTWSASMPATALSLVEPVAGEPVELAASVNGVSYRLIVEDIQRDRSFANARITVAGRGRNAMLADPYADVFTFGNPDDDLTAAQLMDEALKDNGVGIGWDVSFGLEDWLIPAGTWSHQGTHMSALQGIAAAGGGYLQPHNTNATMIVLPRYPWAPWDWAAQTPDFELPAAVVTREGISWTNKPDYNRVFVAGSRNGVLCQVTRAGTAGDRVAPMVVDDLITAAAAGRQRGLIALGDTGRQAAVSLALPVLNETGLIAPGKLVRYLDGSATRLGLVRSTALDYDGVTLRQTIGVETHVA